MKLLWIRIGSIWAVMLLGGCATTTQVFHDGRISLPVIIAADAAPEERAAADELARVLGQMSGLPWPVRRESCLVEPGIFVGHSSFQKGPDESLILAKDFLAPQTGEIGPDGFSITIRGGSVFIAGATPAATGFAVNWLLQHQGGVRWYAPGKSGEIIPRRTEWSLPDLRVVREPAYVSREISGLETGEEKLWAWHNGLSGRLNYSHALGRVFGPEILAQHPDWAPQRGALRYGPRSGDDQNWQPNLALPEVAEFAAQQAKSALAHDPALKSFSLGINDSIRFDESPATRTLVEPLHYFRGMPDYSPLVFTFMNRAAQSLADIGPNRYLGCLAYFWCENPPSFPLQRNVVPYVTTDRTQYYDQEYRAADLALMSRWGASGVKAFGLWEYAYGRGFLVPRQPLGALAESVREGWRRGARGYQAEVGPQWGFDAFKIWMLAQLLWEPERSPEDLADDFYAGFYGAAARPVRRFFKRCEQQWMTQRGSPYWLKYYFQEDQALLFPWETCHELRGLLTAAARAVGDDPVAAERVEKISRAFAVTEAYQQYDAIRRRLAGMGLKSIREKETALAVHIRELMHAETTFRDKFKVATEGGHPAMTEVDLNSFVRNDPVSRVLWLAGQSDPLAPRRILEAAGPEAVKRVAWRPLADVIAGGQWRAAPNLAVNSAFVASHKNTLEPKFLFPKFGMLPAKWEITAMPTEAGKLALVGREMDRSEHTLRIEGAWDTQVFQWIPTEPDCVYVATVQMRGKASPGNDSALFLTFLDREGKVVGPAQMQALSKGMTTDWRNMVLAARVPDEAAWVGIGVGANRQQTGDVFEVASMELRGVISDETP